MVENIKGIADGSGNIGIKPNILIVLSPKIGASVYIFNTLELIVFTVEDIVNVAEPCTVTIGAVIPLRTAAESL